MRSVYQSRFEFLQEQTPKIMPLFLAVLVGVGMGVVAVIANQAPNKWMVVILLAVATPAVVLLVNDLRKLVLIAMVIDISLGLDIALQYQDGHQGGPSGYIVSLMTVALIVGYAIWIVEREPKPRFFAVITVPALVYLFMVVLSLSQSVNMQLSLFGVFLKCQVFLMFFYIANHLRSWQDFRLVVTTVVISLLLQAALMLLQYFTGASLSLGAISSFSLEEGASAGFAGSRVGGTFGGPNSAAAFLVCTLLIAFGAYLSDRLVNRTLALLACALGIVALFATGSRAAWASLVLALLILLSQVVWTKAGKKALLILLIGALFIGIFFGQQIWVRLEAVKTDTTRQELAFMAYNIIRAFPMGVGENNYDQIMSDEYAHPNWVGRNLMVVHNKYLLVWAETGPQGLAAFVFLMLSTVWLARRWLFRTNLPPNLVILAASLLGAFLGYAFHMITEAFSSRANVQIMWFLIAMIVALDQLIFPSKQDVVQQGSAAPSRVES
jgi:O-antigen ligase